jgi:hypothetical protein
MTADLRRDFMTVANALPSVFRLADEDVRLVTLLDEVYSEDPDPAYPEACERHDQAIAELEAEFRDNEALVVQKAERYLHVLAHFAAIAKARRDTAARLKASADAAEHATQRIKDQLLTAMQTMDRDRIETPSGTVRIQPNSQPTVQVLDAAAVPHSYERKKIIVEVDKLSILRDYKQSGIIPPGVSIVHGHHLRLP